jgi:hypothetical protein
VLDGNGLGVSEAASVSVAASVGVLKAVSVGTRCVAVSVTGENAVLVGGSVSATVVGVKGEVELQANNARVNRMEKMIFRLIG